MTPAPKWKFKKTEAIQTFLVVKAFRENMQS